CGVYAEDDAGVRRGDPPLGYQVQSDDAQRRRSLARGRAARRRELRAGSAAMTRACRHVVATLALLVLAACGAGDPQGNADRLAPEDDQAALAPEALDEAARLEEAEAPTSARFQLGAH